MDYRKTESQDFNQNDFAQPEAPKPEISRTKVALGELGRQAIFSENQGPSDDLIPDVGTPEENNNLTPKIKITDTTPPEKENQGNVATFQPSTIYKNGDKISQETLGIVENIANSMESNPAQAVIDIHEARRIYQKTGEKVA